MGQVFGPGTVQVLRLITEISAMTPDDVDAVAEAWRGAPLEGRAAAWAAILDSATPEDRAAIQRAALLARYRALGVSQVDSRRDWAFWSAAWDAAGAVAAGTDPDDPSYRVLVAAMATRLSWLRAGAQPPEIPLQRGDVRQGAWDEPARSPRSRR